MKTIEQRRLNSADDRPPTQSAMYATAPLAQLSKGLARLRQFGTTGLIAMLVFPLVIYPLTRLIWQTMWSNSENRFTLAPYREALASSITFSAIWGTIWLTIATLFVAVPLAIALAWITSSTDAPLARRLALLPIISLAVPPLVGSIGWLVLLAPQAGLLNIIVRATFQLKLREGPFDAFSLPVIVLVMALYVVPYVYGPVFAAFKNLDSSLQEAAHITGASFITIARTILLPVLQPAILAGTLIGGVIAASTFVIPLVLASGTGLHVIPTLVYEMVNQEGRPEPATALASFLSVFTIAGLFLYLRVLGNTNFVTISGKGMRASRVSLGWRRLPATGLLLIFLFLSIILPMLALIYMSLVGFWGADVFSQPLSLRQYASLLNRPFALQALINSGWLAVASATLAVSAGMLVGYTQLRRTSVANSVLSFVATLPLGVPAIVLGLAVLFAYTGNPLPLYGTPAILIVGYSAHQLPIGVRNAEAGLRQIAPDLEEAGLIAGDSAVGVLRRITIPLVRHSLLSAWALAFIILFRDLPISILMYTSSTIVSSVALMNIFEQGSLPATAAYSIIITVISGAVVWLVMNIGQERVV